VHKDGSTTVVFQDFTTPSSRPLINTAQLQKMCRANALGYIIQIPLIEAPSASSDPVTIPPVIAALLQQYDDLFANTTSLPPERAHDHEIVLKPDSKPPNIRPYRVPHQQKEEVEKLI
jgi:hypothetical protein